MKKTSIKKTRVLGYNLTYGSVLGTPSLFINRDGKPGKLFQLTMPKVIRIMINFPANFLRKRGVIVLARNKSVTFFGDKYGDSSVTFRITRDTEEGTFGCGHSHDCCGCSFGSVRKVAPFITKTWSSRNI